MNDEVVIYLLCNAAQVNYLSLRKVKRTSGYKKLKSYVAKLFDTGYSFESESKYKKFRYDILLNLLNSVLYELGFDEEVSSDELPDILVESELLSRYQLDQIDKGLFKYLK